MLDNSTESDQEHGATLHTNKIATRPGFSGAGSAAVAQPGIAAMTHAEALQDQNVNELKNDGQGGRKAVDVGGLAGCFEPGANSPEKSVGESGMPTFGGARAQPFKVPRLADKFMEPTLEGEVHQYEISRTNHGFLSFPTFQLTQGGKFILSARRRKKTGSPNYVISASADDTSVNSPSIVGCMRSADGLITGVWLY